MGGGRGQEGEGKGIRKVGEVREGGGGGGRRKQMNAQKSVECKKAANFSSLTHHGRSNAANFEYIENRDGQPVIGVRAICDLETIFIIGSAQNHGRRRR